jgi:hypothetical protein
MRTRALLISLVVLAGLTAGPAGIAGSRSVGHSLAFRISFSSDVRKGSANGRVYVFVSRHGSPQPRFQVDVTDGAPVWGKDVSGMRPGEGVNLGDGAGVYGYPFVSLSDLPAGTYDVQSLLNVYTTFHRSDGSVIQAHMPCGDGGFFPASPGNLYSDVRQVTLGPGTGVVDLPLTHLITPSEPVPPGGTCQQGNPANSAHMRHVKIKSALLSAFWGRPIYIGADVLLPEGYNHGSMRYPVIYDQTHYPSDNPFGFHESLNNPFSRWWVSFAAPRMLAVTIRHENPFFDDSYAVNSANLGPYGDAITKELMPYIDAHFRTIPHRWARALTGGSTGGWEAMAQQVFYPQLYAGVWAACPDPVDFRFEQLVNVYQDPNAYATPHEFLDVPRPAARDTTGETFWTMEQENHWEAALGTHGRSQLGQWDIWQAVYGPQGADGYPATIWNKITGKIDHAVAKQWQPKDIRIQLARHWATLGPELTGRIHVFVGDADTFFLNDAVHLLQQSLDSETNPPADAEFLYGRNKPHCWLPFSLQGLVQAIANALQQGAPAGADTSWAARPTGSRPVRGAGSIVLDPRQTGWSPAGQ